MNRLKEDRAAYLRLLPQLPIQLSEAQMAMIDVYAEELYKWSAQINLISPVTRETIYTRHILDSLQLVSYVSRETNYLDIGCGGGLPAVLYAIYGVNSVTACDIVYKKISFLENIKRKLKLDNFHPVHCAVEKIEVKNGRFTVIGARAFASLEKILDLTTHLRHDKTLYILPKGKSYQEEIIAAQKKYQMTFTLEQSITNQDAKIILLTCFT